MSRIFLCISAILLFSFTSYSQCNNVNLAESLPQGNAFGSTSLGVMEPWRAFDGGNDEEYTRWSPNDTSQVNYVGIDLGAQYNICTVYLEMGSLDYATNLKIQGSNDMSNWTDLISLTGNTQNLLTIDNLPSTGTYRYIRALFLKRVYDWSYYNVYEFHIYNRVVNTPPNIDLTAPVNGASFIQGTSINFSSTASDLDGSISKVEYYRGTTKIGEAITAPYTFNWTGAAVGTYAIEAKAIDNGGAFTWTDPSNITVTAASSSGGWSLTGNTGINPTTQFIGNTDAQALLFKTNGVERIRIGADGYVGIGQPTRIETDAKLAVNGTIYTSKLTVTQLNWADYVFASSYHLQSLRKLENYINLNKHLPDIPSQDEVKARGVSIGDNQALLLKKIEELTLYLIKQDKQLQRQKREITALKKIFKK